MDGGTDVVDGDPPLALALHEQLAAIHGPRHRVRRLGGVRAGCVDPPSTASYRVLERRLAGGDPGRGQRCHARRQRRGKRADEPLVVDTGHPRRINLGVEILSVGAVSGGEGQPECNPRPGTEPGRVDDGNRGATQRPLPDPGHIAVRCEANLPVLREPEPDTRSRHLAAPTSERSSSRTGTSPPCETSMPVPWLPPAGGTADATTCSMP